MSHSNHSTFGRDSYQTTKKPRNLVIELIKLRDLTFSVQKSPKIGQDRYAIHGTDGQDDDLCGYHLLSIWTQDLSVNRNDHICAQKAAGHGGSSTGTHGFGAHWCWSLLSSISIGKGLYIYSVRIHTYAYIYYIYILYTIYIHTIYYIYIWCIFSYLYDIYIYSYIYDIVIYIYSYT